MDAFLLAEINPSTCWLPAFAHYTRLSGRQQKAVKRKDKLRPSLTFPDENVRKQFSVNILTQEFHSRASVASEC